MTSRIVIRDTRAAPGRGPAGLAWDGQRLWHADYRDGRIYAIDLEDWAVRGSLYCPGNLSGVAWDGRSLWQSLFDQEMIRRINPETNDFDETIILEGRGWLSGVAWDGRKLWTVAQQTGLLLSIDLETNQFYPPVPGPLVMGDIDFHDDCLWAATAGPMAFDSALGRFNWLSDSPDYAVVQLDPTDGRVINRYQAEALYSGLCWVGEGLWLAHSESRSIFRAGLE